MRRSSSFPRFPLFDDRRCWYAFRTRSGITVKRIALNIRVTIAQLTCVYPPVESISWYVRAEISRYLDENGRRKRYREMFIGRWWTRSGKKRKTKLDLSRFSMNFSRILLFSKIKMKKEKEISYVSFLSSKILLDFSRPFQKLILKRGGKNLNHR